MRRERSRKSSPPEKNPRGNWPKKKPMASDVMKRPKVVVKASRSSKSSLKGSMKLLPKTYMHMATGSVRRTSNGSARSTKWAKFPTSCCVNAAKAR